MARQGCRNHRFIVHQSHVLFAIFVCFAINSTCVSVWGNEPSGADFNLDYRLELTWKSKAPRIWAGDIRVANHQELVPLPGRLSEPGNLTAGMLMSGGIHIEPAGDILQFAPPPSADYLRDRAGQFVSHRTTSGGVVFRVQGRDTDRLLISLRRDDSTESSMPIAINLNELAGGRSIESRFSDSATWSIRRIDGDRLRVNLLLDDSATSQDNDGSVLFWDDQAAAIHIQSDSISDDSLELVCETLSSGTQVVAPQVFPVRVVGGRGQVIDSKWQPPSGDGSYEIRWKLRRRADYPTENRGGWNALISDTLKESLNKSMTVIRGTSDNPVIAESRSNVVVLSRSSQIEAADQLTTIGRVEPFGRSWSVTRFIPVRQATQLASLGVTQSLPKRTVIAERPIAELPAGGYWEHTLPVGKVRERHRMRITFPDAMAMRLGVVVLDRESSSSKLQIIRDVTITRTRLKTGQSSGTSTWASAEIDFYPQSSSPQLMIINRNLEKAAMFEAIDVSVASQKVDGTDAPSATVPNLNAGRNTLLHLSTDQWIEWFGDLNVASDNASPIASNDLAASTRLVETVKRCGYSGVMMPVYQDGRSLYPTSSVSRDLTDKAATLSTASRQPQTLELLLRLFDRESLTFVPCLRPNAPMTRLEKEILDGNAQSRGITPANPWSGFDLSLDDVESLPACVYNPLHDSVSEQSAQLVNELVAQTKDHRCVTTIGILADEGSCFRLPSRRATVDNTTLDQFFESLPPDTLVRSQVMGWINDEGSTSFDRWRSERFCSMVKRCADTVRSTQRRLMIICTRDQISPELLNCGEQDRSILLTWLYRRNQLQPLASRCRDEATSSVSFSSGSLFADQMFQAGMYLCPDPVISRVDGDLQAYQMCGLDSSVPLRTITQTDSATAASVFTKLISRCDRTDIILSGLEGLNDSPSRRESFAVFNALPPVVMNDVAASDKAMKLAKVRSATYQGSTYIIASNHCRWPVVVNVALPLNAPLVNVITTGTSPERTASGNWQAVLEPGAISAVCVPNSLVAIHTWSAQVVGDAAQFAEIGKVVRELADAIAIQTEPQICQYLENPSFESAPSLGLVGSSATPAGTSPAGSAAIVALANVPGWLMAQHPAGAATLDSEVAFEGKQSIRLSNREGRPGGTWIVSRAIKTPESQRIATSLMVRGEPSENPDDSKPIMLRIAIEGAVAGSSMRQVVAVNVPRNGKWSKIPCRVEVDSLPRCGIDSLRLAVDVMNEGTVWIDNVQVEDAFLTSVEKSQLQSQMFLALGGIENGEFSQAAKLFELHSVQEMLGRPAFAPRQVIANDEQTPDAAEPVSDKGSESAETPGIAERIRAWLPKPVRF